MIFYTNDISVYIGNLNPVSHEHNALEISIGVGAPLTLKLDGGKSIIAQAFVICPNQKHQILISPLVGEKITINLDAELLISRKITLKIKAKSKIYLALNSAEITQFVSKIPKLKIQAAKDNGACIYKEISILVKTIFPTLNDEPLPNIDDRVQYIVEHIKQNLKNQTFCFKDLAKEVDLSEGRLAHLFKAELGIPFRKYVLWTRLKTAVVHILDGESITQASYIAGFFDSSHFSNVYFKMFGLKPSAPLRD